MTFSEALDQINLAYMPGLVRYYAKQSPDPWQAAHDQLEKVLVLKDEELLDVAINRFLNRCMALIEDFKKQNIAPRSLDPADGFHMGEQKLKEFNSRREKYCVQCESKTDLSIVSDPKDKVSVVLVCLYCKPFYLRKES